MIDAFSYTISFYVLLYILYASQNFVYNIIYTTASLTQIMFTCSINIGENAFRLRQLTIYATSYEKRDHLGPFACSAWRFIHVPCNVLAIV